MDWWRIVCCAAAGYLLGSCNGAIVVSHTCMHDDIRKKGSGNAGLTNFLRNFGGWATLLVVLMDRVRSCSPACSAAGSCPETRSSG